MKVGTISYSIHRGLGYLAKAFYDHRVITDVLVVEHASIPTNGWFPESPRTSVKNMDKNLLRDFCRSMDALLFFETPYDWSLIPFCREHNVRTYVCVMYECFPASKLYGEFTPTRYVCPSDLDMQYFPRQNVRLNLPVEYPWRLRETAQQFVHNAGYLGIRYREGTLTLIDAMSHVKSPMKLTIRCQENVPPEYQQKCAADPRIEYVARQVPYEELYGTGDVAVGAQKWNGCSLVLQEAHASGMLVMNTDRHPMNGWLPKEPLIPVERYVKSKVWAPGFPIDEAVVNPLTMAAHIDSWFNRDIRSYSEQGRVWAEENSWERLAPAWRAVLEGD